MTKKQKKISTIIIITVHPFSERDYVRFGIDTFLENGYAIKVFVIFPMFTQNYADNVIPEIKNGIESKIISSANKIRSELRQYSPENCMIIMNCHIVYNSLKLYRVLKEYSIDYSIVNLGSIPAIKNDGSLKSAFIAAKIKRYIQLFSLRAVCDKFLTILPKKYYWLLGVTPAKYYLVGGAIALEAPFGIYFSDKTTIINAHSMDYDRYLEMDAYTFSVNDINSKYCVFIDQYLPHHPDNAVSYGKSPCSEEKYYSALNIFFEYIEKKFDIKVIIAAHPRADYSLHPNAYPNRTIILGKTNYLVRDADFVIMHNSTAISYAVLFKKPILFLTTNELIENYGGMYNDSISTFAQYFGQAPINIDTDYSQLSEIPKINEKLYDKYINDYIKIKGSPDKKIWEIFIDEIEKC
ncbi:MAG: hypothetical protein II893_04060 [Methanomicrobium sp.]|nr:hypothetical protein [Methanomicrobium sp.]